MEDFDDIIEVDNTDDDNLKVIYVNHLGVDFEGNNIYQMLLSHDTEDTWAEFWEQKPACNCGDLTPDTSMYDYVKEFKAPFKFDLAQDNCSFSMQDCRDHCVALASENLDEAEEYPEVRVVIQFGDDADDVERLLLRRNIRTKFI